MNLEDDALPIEPPRLPDDDDDEAWGVFSQHLPKNGGTVSVCVFVRRSDEDHFSHPRVEGAESVCGCAVPGRFSDSIRGPSDQKQKSLKTRGIRGHALPGHFVKTYD